MTNTIRARAKLAWAQRLRAWVLHPVATPERRRTTVVMVVVLLLFMSQYARGMRVYRAPESDGFFSWAYATSLSFDHDLDFTNDYEICGYEDSLGDAGAGRPGNQYYVGPALLWTPILTIVRLFYRLPANAPESWRHACNGPWPQLVGWSAPVFTMLTVWLAYRVARRRVSQPYALAGALVGAFGTTLVTYGASVWFYSHLWSAFGAALAMLAFVRATERPESVGRWALFGLAVAFAALMRPQEGVWIVLGAVWWVATVVEAVRSRAQLLALARPPIAWTLGFASLYWVQLVIYKKLYGVYWLVPQGKLWLQLGHAHPFLMLFSGYSGWFTWTPLVWLGVFGLLWLAIARGARVLGIGLLLVCALEIFISSSALAWTGSGTSGQRMLTSLAPAVVVGAAVVLERFGEWATRSRDRSGLLIVLACTAPLMFMTWGTPFVDPGETRGSAVYGAAVSKNFEDIERKVGNPFTLPATEVFSLRYGVPRQKFDALAFTGHFVRSYKTADAEAFDTLTFAEPPEWVVYAEGIEAVAGGARIRGGRGRFLITLYWPWITHLRVEVQRNTPKDTSVRFRSRGVDLGGAVYRLGGDDIAKWPLPPGGLDSGINEILVETDGDVTLQRMVFIDESEHDLSLQ